LQHATSVQAAKNKWTTAAIENLCWEIKLPSKGLNCTTGERNSSRKTRRRLHVGVCVTPLAPADSCHAHLLSASSRGATPKVEKRTHLRLYSWTWFISRHSHASIPISLPRRLPFKYVARFERILLKTYCFRFGWT